MYACACVCMCVYNAVCIKHCVLTIGTSLHPGLTKPFPVKNKHTLSNTTSTQELQSCTIQRFVMTIYLKAVPEECSLGICLSFSRSFGKILLKSSKSRKHKIIIFTQKLLWLQVTPYHNSPRETMQSAAVPQFTRVWFRQGSPMENVTHITQLSYKPHRQKKSWTLDYRLYSPRSTVGMGYFYQIHFTPRKLVKSFSFVSVNKALIPLISKHHGNIFRGSASRLVPHVSVTLHGNYNRAQQQQELLEL